MNIILVNKASGSGFSETKLRRVISGLPSEIQNNFKVLYPESRVEMSQISKSVCLNTSDAVCETILVWGGDGTLNAVVEGLMMAKLEGRDLPVLIPLGGGSGSDFIRALKAGKTPRGAVINCDVGRFTDVTGNQVRWFLNGFSMGVSAEIAGLKEQMPRWLPGALKYLFATSLRVSRGNLRVTIKFADAAKELLSLLIVNGGYVGGGMRISKSAQINDGMMNGVILETVNIWKIIRALIAAYTSSVESLSWVQKCSVAQSYKFQSDKPVWCESDGEVYQTIGGEINILSGALRVRAFFENI